MSLRLKELAQYCDAELIGDQNLEIEGVSNLRDATASHLSLFIDKRYIKDCKRSKAAAVLTNKLLENEISGNKLVVDNPLLALAHILKKFDDLDPDVASSGDICPSAHIADSAQIGAGASIAAQAVIGENVILGEGVKVGSGSVIYRDVVIGKSTVIDANVTLYHACEIGHRCHISGGTVIGADGFGFAESITKHDKQWIAIAQIGKVVIGNDVHIGANTAIDRGSLDDTIISDDVIIDNLVQIAHNVKIGRHTAIAGCAAIAGSTEIGKNCKIGGRASIVGHLKLCDDVTVLASSLVTKSITKAGAYSSSMPAMPAQKWRKVLAKFRHNISN